MILENATAEIVPTYAKGSSHKIYWASPLVVLLVLFFNFQYFAKDTIVWNNNNNPFQDSCFPLYFKNWNSVPATSKRFRAQSFTSLMEDLCHDIK